MTANGDGTDAARIAALLDQNDITGVRAALLALLAPPGSAARLRALDGAGLLTRIIPELEPARNTDQPIVHFLPVLAHSLEAVAAVEWLLDQVADRTSQIAGARSDDSSKLKTQNHGLSPVEGSELSLPVAVQTHPWLRYRSVYHDELRRHFDGAVGRYPRAALFKLAALLHDVAKPQTKQAKPGGGVSFHQHQSIGGEIAAQVARRLGFDQPEAAY